MLGFDCARSIEERTNLDRAIAYFIYTRKAYRAVLPKANPVNENIATLNLAVRVLVISAQADWAIIVVSHKT